jgi:hypothetical protein
VAKKTKKQVKVIEDEFERIAEVLANQGDVGCLCGMVPLDDKERFIKEWHEE